MASRSTPISTLEVEAVSMLFPARCEQWLICILVCLSLINTVGVAASSQAKPQSFLEAVAFVVFTCVMLNADMFAVAWTSF